MDKILIIFLIGIGLSLITVFGDTVIKHSSMQPGFSGWKWLLLGGAVYSITAVGWFFVFRNIKISTAAVLYSLSCIIFLVIISVLFFKEKLSPFEALGIGLAISSLVILYRFA